MYITEWNALKKAIENGLLAGVTIAHDPISHDLSKAWIEDPDYSPDYLQSLLVGPFRNVNTKEINLCLDYVNKTLCKLGYVVNSCYSSDRNEEYWNILYKRTSDVDMHVRDEEDLQ